MPELDLDPTVAILGTGSALPRRRVPNSELEGLIRGYDAESGDFATWVDRVTHIQERAFSDPTQGETAGSIGEIAARHAIDAAGIPVGEIDQMIFCSFTYGDQFPGEHVHLVDSLGIDCGTFAMTAACAGSLFGVTLARSLVQSGQCRNVLVVGSEMLSRVIDWGDPITAILFADAAGAVVVGRKDRERTGGFIGQSVLRSQLSTNTIMMKNGNCPPDGTLPGHDARVQERQFLGMRGGPRVLRNAINKMSTVVCESLGYTLDDLKNGNPELRALLDRAKIVPHQANGRILDGLQKALGVPRDNLYRTVYHAGNSSAATNVYTLDYAVRVGNQWREDPAEGQDGMGIIHDVDARIEPGDVVVLVSIGAGYLYGAVSFVHVG